ncbi:helix-turn-helix domain-containing protein [Erythrobacter sp. YT30]|uniref:helix-turn-helix domain-containing protein n=1 Tax=Erythrobacter sp. YT30 TaxID=1735012 RepID=UPI00076C84B9|nr:helix-turn-helix domain-containing protein [Erythrobacter sp. YT30]KWV90996.1 hypothetical protein AUC45_06610 [Erythrobacter sp. YT30]
MDSEQETGEGESIAENEPAGAPLGPGEKLRAARLEKGWDLAFIAAETRIATHHLEALEKEDFDHMASRAYAIGFARNYARAVGLDETEITDAVRAEMADESERRAAITGGMEPGDPAKLPSAGLAWFGAIAAIILAAGVYAFYTTYYASGPGLGSLLADGDEAAEGETETASTPQEEAISADGQVVFTALDDEIWVRFFVEDGDVLLEKTLMRGDTFEVPRNVPDVQLNTGRPQFLQITIDGQPVPKLADQQVTLVEPVSAAALIERFALNTAAPAPAETNTAPVASPNPTPSTAPAARPTQSAPTQPTPRPSPTQPAPSNTAEPEAEAPPQAAPAETETEPAQTAPAPAPQETSPPASEPTPEVEETPPTR